MDILIIGLNGLSYNMLNWFDIIFPHLDPCRNKSDPSRLMNVDTISRTSEPSRLSRDDLPIPSVESETEQQRKERNDAVQERLCDLGYKN